MTFYLVAHQISDQFTGEIGRESFENEREALREMEMWAKHGVDGYCNEAHHIGLYNGDGKQIFIWDWAVGRALSFDDSE
jgi:hypothetical protein